MRLRLVLSFLCVAAVAASCATSAAAPPPASVTAPTIAVTTTATTIVPPTSAPAPTITTTTARPRLPIVIGFAGDTSFTHGLDAHDPLGDITAELSAPDLMLVNLETTVAEPDVGTRVDKTYTFKSPPHAVTLLTDAGIDGVQLANNHTLDFGRPALLRTLELLDTGDLPHAGAGSDRDAAYAPAYFEVRGWTIGLVAFSHIPCGWADAGQDARQEIAWTCDGYAVDGFAAVQEAADHADLVVVMVHWGIELDHCPQDYQRSLAEVWAGFGADLIIGGHPHVLQGVERVGDAWLVHSTGNFAFPSARQASARSAMFEFTVTEDDVSLRAIPVRITAGRPAAATGDDATAILSDLGRWSFGFTFDDAGTAVPADAPGACS